MVISTTKDVVFNGTTVWHAELLRSDEGKGNPVISELGTFEMAADAAWI